MISQTIIRDIHGCSSAAGAATQTPFRNYSHMPIDRFGFIRIHSDRAFLTPEYGSCLFSDKSEQRHQSPISQLIPD